jgi:hypothetical protein
VKNTHRLQISGQIGILRAADKNNPRSLGTEISKSIELPERVSNTGNINYQHLRAWRRLQNLNGRLNAAEVHPALRRCAQKGSDDFRRRRMVDEGNCIDRPL